MSRALRDLRSLVTLPEIREPTGVIPDDRVSLTSSGFCRSGTLAPWPSAPHTAAAISAISCKGCEPRPRRPRLQRAGRSTASSPRELPATGRSTPTGRQAIFTVAPSRFLASESRRAGLTAGGAMPSAAPRDLYEHPSAVSGVARYSSFVLGPSNRIKRAPFQGEYTPSIALVTLAMTAAARIFTAASLCGAGTVSLPGRDSDP